MRAFLTLVVIAGCHADYPLSPYYYSLTLRWKAGEDKPVTLMGLAMSRGRKATRTVHWREGSRGRQGSRFGVVRVRTAHLHDRGEPPGSEQWFLYEWPSDEKEPTKFWLSTLAGDEAGGGS
jgi:hypothetical protein